MDNHYKTKKHKQFNFIRFFTFSHLELNIILKKKSTLEISGVMPVSTEIKLVNAILDGMFPSVFRLTSSYQGKWNEVPKWSGVTVSQLIYMYNANCKLTILSQRILRSLHKVYKYSTCIRENLTFKLTNSAVTRLSFFITF